MSRLAHRFALLLALLGAASAVRADDDGHTIKLTIASSHSTSLAWVGTMHNLVVPETNRRLTALGSPYRIRWTEAYGGSLYKYDNTLEAIEIGLTDLGWVGTLWELSKMPLQNVTYYVPFSSDDNRMIFAIFNELHETLPAMTEAWTAQNQKFLGASVFIQVPGHNCRGPERPSPRVRPRALAACERVIQPIAPFSPIALCVPEVHKRAAEFQ